MLAALAGGRRHAQELFPELLVLMNRERVARLRMTDKKEFPNLGSLVVRVEGTAWPQASADAHSGGSVSFCVAGAGYVPEPEVDEAAAYGGDRFLLLSSSMAVGSGEAEGL
jgi:hypothetical protein